MKSLYLITYLCAIILSGSTPLAEAVQGSPHSFQHRQPDDTLSPPLFVRGNHRSHVITDANGFTVVDDERHGWKVYATLNETSGHLRPTGLRVGLHDPVKALEAGLLRGKMEMPSWQMQWEACGRFCSGLRNVSLIQDDHHVMKKMDGGDTVRRRVVSNVAASTGSRKNLVVLIRFADHDDRDLPSANDISSLMNNIGGHPILAPTGSVRDFYRENSYNKLDIISTVRSWIRLPETEAYYADKHSGATKIFESSLRQALDTLDFDPNISFKDFDADGDGVVDAVTFLHSGYGAEWGEEDCHGKSVDDRIWAHKWTLDEDWVSRTGYKVFHYHTSGALWSTCGKEISRIGTLAHELGHILGLPDLYSTGSGVGSYGLMGNSWGFDGTQRYPPMMSPWSRIQLGWVEPKEIKANGLYEIEASALKPDIYIISSPFPPNEYLLIENRQPLKFDAKMPQGGLIIWHIDDDVVSLENNPGYPGQFNWPENGKHYHVAVLQADGRYELEKGLNRGDGTDVWNDQSLSASIGPSLTQFGRHPNTDSYQDGVIKQTGVTISDISSSSSKMSFYVTLSSSDPSNNLVIPPSNTAISESNIPEVLFTTMEGGNGSYGVMFEIHSTHTHSIIVRNLSFQTRSRGRLRVEAYTKVGSHLEAEESQWTLVADVVVSGMGYLKLTSIPDVDFDNVRILPGATQSFFIFLDSPDMRYSATSPDEFLEPFVSNSYFEIITGSGIGRGKFQQLFSNRIFNGEVRYSVENGFSPRSNMLTTTYNDNNGNYGSMFDVKVLKSVVITGIDVHVQIIGSVKVEVWTKIGGHKSYEQNQDLWTKIIATNIEGRGTGQPTLIPVRDFIHLEVNEGETHAFYITFRTFDLRYTNGEWPVSNEHLQILTGSGVSYPFGNSFYPRSFNGALHYQVNGNSDESPKLKGTDISPKSNDMDSLITSYQGGNGSFGCMFDIVAENEIIIHSLEVHTRLTQATWISVYTQKGGHTEPPDWGKPIFKREVVGQGNSNHTPLPNEYFTPVRVMKGEVQAFYVTLRSPDLRYTNGISLGRTYSSNSDLSILEGTGVGSYKKFDKLISPRVFNGVVHYEKVSDESSSITQLQTSMEGETGSFGNIFNVKAKRNLKITSMSIHTSSTDSILVEVWTRKGSYVGNTQDLNDWDRIAEGFIDGNGKGVATIIPQKLFTSVVELSTHRSQAFYVTLRSASMRYSKLSATQDIIVENGDMQIISGYGVGGYPMMNSPMYHPRAWNGSLFYQNIDLSYVH